MGNINFGNQKENIQENAGSIFTGDMPQEKADSFAGAIPQPQALGILPQKGGTFPEHAHQVLR